MLKGKGNNFLCYYLDTPIFCEKVIFQELTLFLEEELSMVSPEC